MSKRKNQKNAEENVEVVSKSVILSPDIVKRIETVQEEQGSRSFSSTAALLLKQALEGSASGDSKTQLNLSDLPSWLSLAVQEVSKINGLEPKATLIDLVTHYIRDYLERARQLKAEISSELESYKPKQK